MKIDSKFTTVIKMAMVMLCFAQVSNARDHDGRNSNNNSEVWDNAKPYLVTFAEAGMGVMQANLGLIENSLESSPKYNMMINSASLLYTMFGEKFGFSSNPFHQLSKQFSHDKHKQDQINAIAYLWSSYGLDKLNGQRVFTQQNIEFVMNASLVGINFLKWINPSFCGLDSIYSYLAIGAGGFRVGKIVYNYVTG